MSREPKRGLCGVCQRHVPIRKDGRLRAHLAERSSASRREACDGSGGYSARVELEHVNGGPAWRRVPWSAAAAFNARDEWDKADALWAEYEDMRSAGAADPEAEVAAYDAYSRAWDEAKKLSIGLYSHSRWSA